MQKESSQKIQNLWTKLVPDTTVLIHSYNKDMAEVL